MGIQVKSVEFAREAWFYTLKNFSYLVHIAKWPFMAVVFLQLGVFFSKLNHHPAPHALVDAATILFEVFWGLRWYRLFLNVNEAHDGFRFGKAEMAYFAYGIVLFLPFLIDDFIVVPGASKTLLNAYVVFALVYSIVVIRFEFIFSGLALGRKTGFLVSLQQTRGLWWSMFKSILCVLLMVLAIGTVGVLGIGLFILLGIKFMNFEGWHMAQGWDVLLIKNPLIVVSYTLLKEGLWIWSQALCMGVGALYYKAAVK